MEQGGGLEEKFNLTRERGRGDRDRQTDRAQKVQHHFNPSIKRVSTCTKP